MTDRHEYAPRASARLTLILNQLRRIRHARGEQNPSYTMLAVEAEAAHKVWKWIPDDELPKAVGRALYVFKASEVTPEKVLEAHRKPGMKPKVEELERRRRMAKEKLERDAAPTDVASEFFGGLSNQLRGETP